MTQTDVAGVFGVGLSHGMTRSEDAEGDPHGALAPGDGARERAGGDSSGTPTDALHGSVTSRGADCKVPVTSVEQTCCTIEPAYEQGAPS